MRYKEKNWLILKFHIDFHFFLFNSRHNNINNNVVQQQQPRSVGSDLIYTNEWSQGICG